MGSIQQDPRNVESEQEREREITVLVTGFGPFRSQYPVNPSWEIAKNLPPFLSPISASVSDSKGDEKSKENRGLKFGGHGGEGEARSGGQGYESDVNRGSQPTRTGTGIGTKKSFPVVRILVHPSPVHVGYEAVRTLVPKLWDTESDNNSNTSESPDNDTINNSVPRRKIDYMIHVGMAGGRNYYSIERRGHRDGYDMRDVDGRLVEGLTDDWVRGEGPLSLQTDIPIDKVWGLWRKGEGMDNQDLRISEDAGRYLCDFIYYSSLNHLWTKNEERRVLFFHVPVNSDEEAVERGVRILEELIRAVVLVGEKGRGAGKGES